MDLLPAGAETDLLERRLRLLLRVIGASLLLAFPCTLLPEAWMARIHAELGLGEFPPGAIVRYLARSTCLLYGMHGLLLWFMAREPRRYAPLLVVTGIAHCLLAPAMLLVDLSSGMPALWTWLEAPLVLPFGIALWLGARSLNSGIPRG